MNEKEQIFKIAELIQQGEQFIRSGNIDISEFSTDEAVKVGCNRLAAAKHLFNLGYRPCEVVAIVEDGMVVGVYTDGELVSADVIDLDITAEAYEEEYRYAKEKADGVAEKMNRIW